MKRTTSYILLLTVLIFSACAHKSGHRERQRTTYSNVNHIQTPRTDTKVEVRNNRGRKLEGSEVFRKYNKAVFMVYTSDGTNTYQGSGFFINSNGLAVSNYHVFKGTGIGAEVIKLSGSNTAYKIVEVLQKSEDGDFILDKSISSTIGNLTPSSSKALTTLPIPEANPIQAVSGPSN